MRRKVTVVVVCVCVCLSVYYHSMHAHTYSRIMLKGGSGNIETWECQYRGCGLHLWGR